MKTLLSLFCAAVLLATIELPAHAQSGVAAEAGSVLGGDGLLESFALSADRGPVRVESSSLEFEYRTGLLVYRGEVVVSQADIKLESDELRVRLDTTDAGRPSEIVALGNVRIVHGERIATGGKAEFDQKAQTITLSENATLRDGPNEVAGDRVVVYIEEERSVVEGGHDRVRAVLYPPGTGDEPRPSDLSQATEDGEPLDPSAHEIRSAREMSMMAGVLRSPRRCGHGRWLIPAKRRDRAAGAVDLRFLRHGD